MKLTKGLNLTVVKDLAAEYPSLSGTTVNPTIDDLLADDELYNRAMNVIKQYADGIKNRS